jgi:hypothetical protein
MRSFLRIIALAWLGLWTASAYAQARVDGQVYALVYAFENLDGGQQWDYYQGLQMRLRPAAGSNLSFKTNLRLARRGDPADWQERVYNAYADWHSDQQRFQVRLGRQFLYKGVLNGSVDAVAIRLQPAPNLEVHAVGGVAVSFDRRLELRKWSEGGMLGAYAAYRVAGQRMNVSYVQRLRDDRIAWRQAGAALTGAWKNRLYYQAQVEYNLEQSAYQAMRYRLTYQSSRWALFGEFNSQKPRVFEDSFFNVFELVAFDQLRSGLNVQVEGYQMGLQYLHTRYERDETGDELILTIGTPWGTIGAVAQGGFGGDKVGIYGDARYDVLSNLTVRLHGSRYNYERRSIGFDEDATAFSGGLLFRPVRPLLIQAELQESMNSFYDNDLRALVRVSYAFNLR